jgi:hypothetical protein
VFVGASSIDLRLATELCSEIVNARSKAASARTTSTSWASLKA